ncbi:MAG: DNA replication/repair protein RecF [Longimicrobiales bacterium]
MAVASYVCRELRLRDYRNFTELALSFPTDGVAIIGENGAGKTNLLEAIYYLEIFRSFRGAPDEQLVRFDAPAFWLRGRFEDTATGTVQEVTAAYEPKSKRKKVTVNGVEPERLGDAIGHVGAVVFSPSDVSIVAGAPGERRRFLDILLSLHEPGYLAALQRFRQALRQRNVMLKRGAAQDLLEAWNEPLLAAAVRVMTTRARWIADHAARFAERYTVIGGGARAELRYVPAGRIAADDAGDETVLRAALDAELGRVARRERERGMTLVGPHRDDLAILLDTDGGAVDLRNFGSGGQVRTGVVALRLIETESLRAARGRLPIILLDDVFAELDPGRARRILELLEAEEHGQVILTAPKASDVDLGAAGTGFVSSLVAWNIAAGQVTQ